MAVIRSPGAQGEAVGPWEGLQAVVSSIDSGGDTGDHAAQMRACLVFLSAAVENVSVSEKIDALRFAADYLGKNSS